MSEPLSDREFKPPQSDAREAHPDEVALPEQPSFESPESAAGVETPATTNQSAATTR